MPGSRSYDRFTLRLLYCAPRHDQAAIRSSHKGGDGTLRFGGVATCDRGYLHAKRRSHRLDGGKLANPLDSGISSQKRDASYAWRDLLEQFHPFCAEAEFGSHEAGAVAAWLRQASDQTRADRIDDVAEYDRYVASRLLQRCRRRQATRH